MLLFFWRFQRIDRVEIWYAGLNLTLLSFCMMFFSFKSSVCLGIAALWILCQRAAPKIVLVIFINVLYWVIFSGFLMVLNICLQDWKCIISMLLDESPSVELSDSDATNLVRLLCASVKKAIGERIVPATDNRKHYYNKAQKVCDVSTF